LKSSLSQFFPSRSTTHSTPTTDTTADIKSLKPLSTLPRPHAKKRGKRTISAPRTPPPSRRKATVAVSAPCSSRPRTPTSGRTRASRRGGSPRTATAAATSPRPRTRRWQRVGGGGHIAAEQEGRRRQDRAGAEGVPAGGGASGGCVRCRDMLGSGAQDPVHSIS